MKSLKWCFLLFFSLLSCRKEPVIDFDPSVVGFWVQNMGHGVMKAYVKGTEGFDFMLTFEDGPAFEGYFQNSMSPRYFQHAFKTNGVHQVTLTISKNKEVLLEKAEQVFVTDALEFPAFEIVKEKVSDWEYQLALISDDPELEVKWLIDQSKYQSKQKNLLLRLPQAGDHSVQYEVRRKIRNTASGSFATLLRTDRFTLKSGGGPDSAFGEVAGIFLGDSVSSVGYTEVRYNGSCCDGAPLGMPIYEFSADNGILVRLLQPKHHIDYSGAERYDLIKMALANGQINLTDATSENYLGLSLEYPARQWLLPVQNDFISKTLEVIKLQEVSVIQVVPEMHPTALDATLRLNIEFKELKPVDITFTMRFYTY